MKTEHSPGPWFVVERNGKLEIAQFDASEEFPRALMATVSDCERNPLCDHAPTVVSNARLIAAAPELLAACEVAIATIERLATRHGPFSSAAGALDVLRQAIARASH